MPSDAKRQALQQASLASRSAQIYTTHTKGDESMSQELVERYIDAGNTGD